MNNFPAEIMGVPVDQEFFKAIETWQQSCDGLRELSRPRHRLDTTDEWLWNFYDCVKEALTILEKLGDQSDLVPIPDELAAKLTPPTLEQP